MRIEAVKQALEGIAETQSLSMAKAYAKDALDVIEQAEQAQQEPETCANCKHNEWPFGMCDGCPKQSDESQTGNWEPEDKQPDYKALYEKAAQQYNELAALMTEQAQPVARLRVFMDSVDMGQSLGPSQEFKFASAAAYPAAKNLPLGEYDLYTTPPPRQPWVGLTDKEVKDCIASTAYNFEAADIARAIQAKLKEKNEGQLPRQPLTDEELYKVFPAIASYTEANKGLYRSIARVIEAAHGIKGEA